MSDTCGGNESPDFCSTIVSNPDISGVGVRIAIYVQTILSMSVASFMPHNDKAFRDISRNSYVMSGSLIIASIIAWKRNQLSLFDGLIVTMLTTTMTAFVTVNTPFIRTLGLSINISSLLFTALWCFWGLQIWTNPSTFGLPPDGQGCIATSLTKFVVFGHSVSPMSHGLRGFAIFVFALGSLTALSSLLTCLRWSIDYMLGNARAAKDAAAERLAKQLRERRKLNPSASTHHIVQFGGLAGMIYMIVTTEQIVAKNQDVSSKLGQWTFSQTLALIMLGQQIMDCGSYFKEELKNRNEDRRLSGSATP
ncbi:hypothetical protein BDV93DRAFT_109109 [Ceratobasidium sp. AG-I]|nr:hypothetical protein BDV93DRAFT_109109 [Ceratobasidium sp. AG-I]